MATPCPTCGYNLDFNQSAEACDICGTPLEKHKAEETLAKVDPTPDLASEATFPSTQSPQEEADETTDKNAQANPQPESVASPRSEPKPVFVSDRNVSRSPLTTPAEIIGPDEISAKNAFEQGKRIITIIGFSNSGKSFFVNRLRHELGDGRWRCDPGFQEEIAQSPEGLELTRLTPFRQRHGQALRYVLVDLAGESFMKAMARRFQEGQEIEGFSSHSYLSAMAFASAYVLLIRYEDVFAILQGIEGDETDKVSNLLKHFHSILSCIVVCSERLAGGQAPETLLERGISKEDLENAFDRKLRCSKPVCVLFSQADRVIEGFSNSDSYDDDPVLFALEKLPKLYNPIADAFRHFRFDFLSAFEGHSTGTRVNYKLPSHGALEAFLWLHGILDQGHPVFDLPRRIVRGSMPTSWAIWMRRFLDPNFREALRKIERREIGI